MAFEQGEWPAPVTAGGVAFAVADWSVCVEPFKLKLVATRRPAGLAAEIQYDACRFAARDVERLALKLEQLLAGLAAARGLLWPTSTC